MQRQFQPEDHAAEAVRWQALNFLREVPKVTSVSGFYFLQGYNLEVRTTFRRNKATFLRRLVSGWEHVKAWARHLHAYAKYNAVFNKDRWFPYLRSLPLAHKYWARADLPFKQGYYK